MLQEIAPNLWHVQHQFKLSGVTVSSRMTVVRLASGKLWLHSPVPLTPQVRDQLAALGEVGYIVAPSKMHHLFLSACAAAYPQAQLFGARGLAKKRPDVVGLQTLAPTSDAGWAADMDQVHVGGVPLGNEVLWFHRASKTLIVTDFCQYWDGEMGFAAALYARLTGVYKRLAVPRTVRLVIKDKLAAADTASQILRWPFERIILAHNAIIERDAHAQMRRALAVPELI
jgi:hypothetical protein